jgi:cytochrome b
MVYVWDWPLRVFHWGLAIAMTVAWLTPNAYDGLHRIAGYTVIALIVFRLVWGFAGPRYSSFRRYPKLLRTAPGYLVRLARRQPGHYRGLNPAGAAMAAIMLLALAMSAITGWMQVTVRFFGVAWVQEVHTVSSYFALVIAVVHLLGVALMMLLQRRNLVLSMITGWKRTGA